MRCQNLHTWRTAFSCHGRREPGRAGRGIRVGPVHTCRGCGSLPGFPATFHLLAPAPRSPDCTLTDGFLHPRLQPHFKRRIKLATGKILTKTQKDEGCLRHLSLPTLALGRGGPASHPADLGPSRCGSQLT